MHPGTLTVAQVRQMKSYIVANPQLGIRVEDVNVLLQKLKNDEFDFRAFQKSMEANRGGHSEAHDIMDVRVSANTEISCL